MSAAEQDLIVFATVIIASIHPMFSITHCNIIPTVMREAIVCRSIKTSEVKGI